MDNCTYKRESDEGDVGKEMVKKQDRSGSLRQAGKKREVDFSK